MINVQELTDPVINGSEPRRASTLNYLLFLEVGNGKS